MARPTLNYELTISINTHEFSFNPFFPFFFSSPCQQAGHTLGLLVA